MVMLPSAYPIMCGQLWPTYLWQLQPPPQLLHRTQRLSARPPLVQRRRVHMLPFLRDCDLRGELHGAPLQSVISKAGVLAFGCQQRSPSPNAVYFI